MQYSMSGSKLSVVEGYVTLYGRHLSNESWLYHIKHNVSKATGINLIVRASENEPVALSK